MVADWRGLVAGEMSSDIQARRGAHINLKEALAGVSAMQKERRGQADKMTNIKATAAYSRYPQAAAKEMGIGGETEGGAITPPAGTRLGKVVYNETGRPTTTYEAPETIDAAFMIKQYNTYRSTAEANNAFIPSGKQVPIPSFKDYVTTNFPEYADEILRQATGKGPKATDDEILELSTALNNPNITRANLEFTAKQEGISVKALMEALAAQIGNK